MFSGAPLLWLAILTVSEAPTAPSVTAPQALGSAAPQAAGPRAAVAPASPVPPTLPTPPTLPALPTPPSASKSAETAPPVLSKTVGPAKPTETKKATAHRNRRPRPQPVANAVGSSVAPAIAAAPSLSPAALRAELAHPTPESEVALRTVGDEQSRLEKLGADIATARTGLRQDTARLETILRDHGGGTGDPTKGATAEPDDPRSGVGGHPGAGRIAPAPPAGTGRGQIDVVSKAMAGMKPEQAAAILTRLDRALAADVLRRMKASDAGAAMGQLRPEVAAEIATEIAVRLAARPEPAKEKL
jgi:hypothetical protein